MKRNDRVLLTWHNLNFCVPLTKEDKQALKQQGRKRRNSLTAPLSQTVEPNMNIRLVGNGRKMK